MFPSESPKESTAYAVLSFLSIYLLFRRKNIKHNSISGIYIDVDITYFFSSIFLKRDKEKN